MPSTYTTNNGIELIATGEQSGTWGSTTNTNLELLDASLDGQVTITLTSAGNSGSPNDLPITDGTASNGRNRMVIFNDGSDLGATAYVQLTPNDSEKIMFIRNALSGSRDIIVFQGTYSASNDYVVPNGTTAVVYFDGAGTGAVAANVFNNAAFDGLQLGTSDVSVNKILDQDDMSGNDASALATQQSIKAYVDSQVGTVDTLAEILANGNTSGGTGLIMSSGDDLTLTGASYNAVWDSSVNSLVFGDNAKAVFGAGDDLQIWHGGSHSYIKDAGTGDLYIGASNNIALMNAAFSENKLLATTDGALTLYYDGSAKLATTNTGVDITGTAVTDGLTSSGQLAVSNGDNATPAIFHGTTGGTGRGLAISLTAEGATNQVVNLNSQQASGIITLQTAGSERFRINSSSATFNESGNDQDFRVESSGATHMLFVDASTSRVGIGEAAPDTPLHLTTSSTGTAVTIESTGGNSASGPDLVLYRNSSSPLADDALGSIKFRGEDSGGATNDYAQIISSLVDPTAGSEDGLMTLQTIVAGTNRNRLTINSTELNINESSRDVDFRVESDNNAHMLFVDGGNDRVGIGQSSPAYKLDVSTSTTGDGIRVFSAGATPPSIDIGSTRGASADVVLAEINGQWDGGEVASIKFESGDDTTNKDDGRISFYTAVSNNSVAERMRIEMDGSIGVGTDSPTSLLHLSKATGGAGSDPIEINIDSTHNGNWTADSDWGHINFRAPNESSTPDGDTHIQIAANAGSSTSGAVNDAVLRIKNVSGTLSERMRWDYDGTISFSDKDGSETARINNDGNFLLGTTTVAYAGTLLNIGTTSDTQNGVQIQTSTTGNGYILFGDGSGADAYRGQIQYEHTDDKLTFRSGGTIRQNLSSTETVFNDTSTDTDFRVESNGNSNMLFVDASIDSVGIGTGSPSSTYALDVAGAVRSSGNAPGYTLLESDASNQQWILGSYAGTLALRDVTAGTYPFQITTGSPTNSILIQSGSVTVNDNSADQDFRVESNGNTHAIFVDAGNDQVAIGTNGVTTGFGFGVQSSTTLGDRNNSHASGGYRTELSGLSITDGSNYYGSYGQLNFFANSTYTSSARRWVITNGYRANKLGFIVGSTDSSSEPILDQTAGEVSNGIVALHFDNVGAATFNDDSQDADFRVESDSNTHMIYVDAGNNKMALGGTNYTADSTINAKDASFGISDDSANPDTATYAPLGVTRTVAGSGTVKSFISLTAAGTAVRGIGLDSGNSLTLGSCTTGKVFNLSNQSATISTTEFIVNEHSIDADFRVESNNKAHMLFVNAGNDRVGINDSDPDQTLSVDGTIQAKNSNSTSIAASASGTVITPPRGYSYINVSRTDTTAYGLLLLVFRTTTNLTIISTIDDRSASKYSASASGTGLVITNDDSSTFSFYASCVCIAFGSGD